MARKLDELVSEALDLPTTSRAELAKQLLESLDNLSESEIEKLWIEEAERRYEAYRAGEIKAVPADEVFARLRARKK
jgi:putative addiction module component (TIGR02574 family)